MTYIPNIPENIDMMRSWNYFMWLANYLAHKFPNFKPRVNAKGTQEKSVDLFDIVKETMKRYLFNDFRVKLTKLPIKHKGNI